MRIDTPLISLVINLDSRPERAEFGGTNLTGVVNNDFLDAGIFNNKKFFEGFDFETIVFIDKHLDIPQPTLDYIYKICDVVCIRNHTDEDKFNDGNFVSALQLARGKYICHVDADCATFASSKESVQELIDLLETYDYVSYPTPFTPNPDSNPNYDYWWCSTRFFMCKRETLDFTEIKKCLSDSDYLYGKYPASIHNPWLEHILGLISKYTTGKGTFYPPLDYDKHLIFCWDNYEQWILRRLNEQSFEEVKNWVLSKSGIHYPNQLHL